MDTKEYLRDRIDHYDLLLEAGKVEPFNPLIKEWRQECINKLYRLREVDMEAMFTGSAFASQFHITNCISLKKPTDLHISRELAEVSSSDAALDERQ